MYKKIYYLSLLALVFFCFRASAQSATYSVKGVAVDSTSGTPLVMATVYIKDMQDSLLLGYALTNTKGAFLVKDIPRDSTARFRIFYTGYTHYNRILRHIKTDVVDLGKISLTMNAHELGAVTVTGEKPPIAIKGDTIEFNASSFKTRPNSVLSDLLKKLPGVDVDQNGNVTANGKTVDKIMLDGKAFFGNDPKIAMQNLPSAIVDKVQITDTKTTEEEMTGDPATGNTKTINITLKKGMDHGYFGRAYAGYGTGKYYDASALINYFKGKRRISLLGATNNINQVGFTMNEMTDLIGRDNIQMLSISDNGSFGINGVQFGGGSGLNKTTSAGFNYNDDYGKHFTLNLSYFYGGITSDNNTRTARQNILPDSVFYYNAANVTHSENISHRGTATLKYHDSTLRITYTPSISISNAHGTNSNNASSLGPKEEPVNQSTSLYSNDDETKQFKNNLDLYKTFKKKNQFLFFHFHSDNKETAGNDYNRYLNTFYDGSAPDDSANQYIDNQVTQNNYEAYLSYSQPLTKSLSLRLEYQMQSQYSLTDKTTFDFNPANSKYSEIDSAYSNKFRSNTITQTPEAGFMLRADSGKWTFSAMSQFNFITLNHYSFTYHLPYKKHQFFITPQVYVQHKFANKGSLYLSYGSYVRQPEINQILPVTDNTNPLHEYIGNPDLKPSVNNNLSVGYNHFDFKSGNNIWASLNLGNQRNAIATVTTFDEQLRQLTTYKNVNGNKNVNLYVDLSKTKKEKNYHWQIKLGSSGRLNYNHAFVNDVPYTSKGYNLSVRPSITYGYKELFELTPSFRYNLQYSEYDIAALNNRQNNNYQAKMSVTLYWPSRITWTSDLNYTHNSDVSPGFNKGYWLWNGSVGLDFLKEKRATLQLSVFDLLNQNVDVKRNITDTYIEDTQTIILHRFFMIKLIYNLKKAGEKEKSSTPFFFF